MSHETTKAVERAQQQINAMLGDNEPKFIPNHARSVLNAALDVEEIARVLHGNPPKLEPETCSHCEDVLRKARELRATILGEA